MSAKLQLKSWLIIIDDLKALGKVGGTQYRFAVAGANRAMSQMTKGGK